MSGLPAGVPVSMEAIDRELWRRQQGYGRGGRMKIETDRARIVSGVRHSKTIGSPIAIIIENKDWKNWTEVLPVEDSEGADDKKKPVTRPRPGHADLAGAIKYNFRGRALCSGARERSRNDGSRGGGRARQGAFEGVPD